MHNKAYLKAMYRSDTQAAPTGPAPTLFEAIVTARCVEASYNGGQVVLAPHVAFVRHGELYVGAATVTRDGKPPREEKIRVFKLDGLAGLRLSEQVFNSSMAFDPADPRFEGTMLAVEPAAG